MKRLITVLLTLILVFSLFACDDKNQSGTDTGVSEGGTESGENQSKGDGEATSGSYKGVYVFNPPTDNYYVEYNDGIKEMHVGNKYSNIQPEDGYSYNVDFEREKIYVPYRGKWYEDTNLTYGEYEDLKTTHPSLFGEMEEGLIHYLRAFGTEEAELGAKLLEYYIGDEAVCGVKCWVFDSKGINATYTKYWVDPSNGAVLKVDHYQSNGGEGYVYEVVEYNTDYTEMGKEFYPESYDDIEKW